MPKTASIPPSGVFSTLTQKAKQTQYLSSIIPSSVISRPTTAGSPSSPKCMPAAFSTRLQWPTYGTSWVEKWRRGTLTSSFHSLGFITPTLSMTWQRFCVVTCDTGFSKNIISRQPTTSCMERIYSARTIPLPKTTSTLGLDCSTPITVSSAPSA